jgi:hypothetical protein
MGAKGILLHKTRIIVLTAVLVSATAGSVMAAQGSARTSMSLAKGSGFSGKSEVVHKDGTVTDTWVSGNSVVRVSGYKSSHASIRESGSTAAGTSATSTLTASVTSSVNKGDPNIQIAAYKAANRSVVQDAINVGISPADAQARFGGMINPPTPGGFQAASVGSIREVGASTINAGAAVATAASIYNSWCASVSQAGGRVKTSACELQYLDQAIGSNWYMGDDFTVSGVSTDTCVWCVGRDSLTQIWGDVAYPIYNQIAKWTPTATASEPSSCRQVTIGLTSPASGLGYSETTSVCANNFGPHNLNTSNTKERFGAVWNGKEPTNGSWYEGAEGIDIVHDPSNASPNATLYVSQTYCQCG